MYIWVKYLVVLVAVAHSVPLLAFDFSLIKHAPKGVVSLSEVKMKEYQFDQFLLGPSLQGNIIIDKPFIVGKGISTSQLSASLKEVIFRMSKIRSKGEEVSPLHRKIFGPIVDGRLYMLWLEKRIRSIELNESSVYSARAEGISIFSSNVRGTIYIPQKFGYLDSLGSLIEDMGILLHEGRHTESDQFNHTSAKDLVDDNWPEIDSCELYNTYRCDGRVDGAYGVEVVFHASVARFCTNCSQTERNEHLRLAMISFGRIVDGESRRVLVENLFLGEWYQCPLHKGISNYLGQTEDQCKVLSIF